MKPFESCHHESLRIFLVYNMYIMGVGYRVGARYKPSLVFRLCLVCSKFKFSAGIQFFGLKTTSQGKPDLKKSFLRSDL